MNQSSKPHSATNQGVEINAANASKWLFLGFIFFLFTIPLLHYELIFPEPAIVLNEETSLVFQPYRRKNTPNVYLRTMQCDKIGEVKTQLLAIKAGATQLLWNASHKRDQPFPTNVSERKNLTVCTSAVLYQPGEQEGLMVPSLSFGYGEFFSPVKEEPVASSEARSNKWRMRGLGVKSKEKLIPIPDPDIAVNPQVGVIQIKGMPPGFRLGRGDQAVVVHAQAIGNSEAFGRMQSSDDVNIQSLEKAIAVSKKYPGLTFVVMTLAVPN
ncbi:MAG TPA: hypothetical protein IGS53_06285 [Leptolyngbyaceae cyanobacterium M33_DOE_097]|uniref:Uncharacterized protein n=1 Tax=Oscillatoriales cyanobacterium SpSt-418 TaxID=2282169 RepID=A0A7C3KIZ7_9CYAN|nr:hypothetical protein [Leptolyngbyaceae cyanobacterium M33_DOE_097]